MHRIDREIDDHLLELGAVGMRGRQVGRERALDAHLPRLELVIEEPPKPPRPLR
ncbi:MAG: hypothetical protein WDN24_15075 [Sphingomonas sp.]